MVNLSIDKNKSFGYQDFEKAIMDLRHDNIICLTRQLIERPLPVPDLMKGGKTYEYLPGIYDNSDRWSFHCCCSEFENKISRPAPGRMDGLPKL